MPANVHNSLPESVRSKVGVLLAARLADLLDLHSQLKFAHWNVKGREFFSLHQLYDQVAETLEDHADDVAERLVQLGGTAEGTVRQAAARSSLPELTALGGPTYIAPVTAGLAALGAIIRADIDRCTNLGDAASADLFTEVARSLDKSLWMVESHGVE
jgi:starvation-inducible DNA-binding protein